VNPMFVATGLADGTNPIALEPVDANGNSQNPYLQAVIDGTRAAIGNGLPASFAGNAFVQLLQMSDPPPNVTVGSDAEPYASEAQSAAAKFGLLQENEESALPLGAAGAGR